MVIKGTDNGIEDKKFYVFKKLKIDQSFSNISFDIEPSKSNL
jgi:hypothetical protein